MGSFIIILVTFAIYCNEVYCDTIPKIAKPEDSLVLDKNDSHSMIEKGIFWKNLNLSKRKTTQLEESRSLDDTKYSETNKKKGRFLNSLAFLTGLSFGGLTTAASNTMKNIAKAPHVFGINLGSSKTSPYFAAYYSQVPYSALLPFFHPGLFGLADAKPQNDQTSQVINLLDNKPIDLAENNEDYTDKENSLADDRVRLQGEADRNAEEKNTIRCKEEQRKHSKGMAREREYLQVNAADLRATLNLQDANQTVDNTTTVLPNNTNTTHHYYHHYHHHHKNPYFPGYYGGYPQNIHHVDLTTQSYSYNVPYEPANFYHKDKYSFYPGLNPSFPPSDQSNEYVGTDFNQLYPSEYQLPNANDGFKPLK